MTDPIDCFVTIGGVRSLVLSGFIRSQMNGPVTATLTVNGVLEGLTKSAPADLTVGGRSITLRILDAAPRADRTLLELVDPAYIRLTEFREPLLIIDGRDNTVSLADAMVAWGVKCSPDDMFGQFERGFGCTLPYELLDCVSRAHGAHFWRDELGARIGMPGTTAPQKIDFIDTDKWLSSSNVVAHADSLIVAGDCVESGSGGEAKGTVLSARLDIALGAKSRFQGAIGEPSARTPRLIPVAIVPGVIESAKPLTVKLIGFSGSPAAAVAMFRRSAGGRYSETVKLEKNDEVRAVVPTEGWIGPIEITPLVGSTAVDSFTLRIPEIVIGLDRSRIDVKEVIDVNSAS